MDVNGELFPPAASVCDAVAAVQFIRRREEGQMQYMASKGMDQSDKKLCTRVLFSVKDGRKRMNARGA